MEKPFDVTATVRLPDGTQTEITFNLFDIKREFPCPLCSTIGDPENISVQSWSDHFARHYVENNRALDINRAIVEDMKRPIPDAVKSLREDLSKYDYAVSAESVYDHNDHTTNRTGIRYVDDIIERELVHRENVVYTYNGMTEEQMLQLAMEESLRESESTAALEKLTAEVGNNTAVLPAQNGECIPASRSTDILNGIVSGSTHHADANPAIPTADTTPVLYQPRRKKNN